jgi:hypothetical protein
MTVGRGAPASTRIADTRASTSQRPRRALEKEAGHGQRPGTPVRLFTFQDEIGELYIVRSLDLMSDRVERDEFDSIRELFNNSRSVPVIVADELTCCRIIAELKGKGDLLVSPAERSFFPSYLVGFATNRQHVEFTKFFGETLELFLAAEEISVSESLKVLEDKLHAELEHVVRLSDALKGVNIDRWAQKLVGRAHTDNYALSPAWRAILKNYVGQRQR